MVNAEAFDFQLTLHPTKLCAFLLMIAMLIVPAINCTIMIFIDLLELFTLVQCQKLLACRYQYTHFINLALKYGEVLLSSVGETNIFRLAALREIPPFSPTSPPFVPLWEFRRGMPIKELNKFTLFRCILYDQSKFVTCCQD